MARAVGAAHYFNEHPEVPSEPRTLWVRAAGIDIELVTDRGVFSGSGLDPGTRYLLTEAPPPPAHGTVVDLGCGHGIVAVALARRAPSSEIVAVDINRRALELCEVNAKRNAVAVRVCHPDDVPADLRVDAIYCNPPIRIGKAALHEFLLSWLDRLQPAGHAYLVVLRHLGSDSLAAWLRDSGFATRRIGSRRGYRLLDVQPRLSTPHHR